MTDACPVCNSPTEIFYNDARNDRWKIRCIRCGEYFLSGRNYASWKPLDKHKIPIISNHLRKNYGIEVCPDLLKRLNEIPQLPVYEKAINLLKYLARIQPIPGHLITYQISSLYSMLDSIDKKQEYDKSTIDNFKNLMPIFAESMAIDAYEFTFITKEFLENDRQFIKYHADAMITITPSGWAFLEELKYKISESDSGFIAMWFDSSLDALLATLESAIRNAGYKPVRIDRHEHINRIDDEIIALIRQSKFIVADFTGQRGGVYFESGFAMGLNKPVFWACNEAELKEVHFDTNHFNYLTWSIEKLGDFQIALQKRIESVLGKGQ